MVKMVNIACIICMLVKPFHAYMSANVTFTDANHSLRRGKNIFGQVHSNNYWAWSCT